MGGEVDLVVSGINHGSNPRHHLFRHSGRPFDAVIMTHAMAVSNGSYHPKYLDDTAEVAARDRHSA